MKRRTILCCMIACVLVVCALGLTASSQTKRAARPRRGAICFDPTIPCKTTATFEAYDLPFRIPATAVIWESEAFYAIILSSVKYTEQECEQRFISEAERTAAQALFPHRKVFTSRCAIPGSIFYTNVRQNVNFMAVYAGHTQAEAAQMLASIKATGKFADASIRRMSAGFNGT
jgi:hypothetical protein